ncbi:MAG: hypothetical protein FWC97_05395 [Treponema sp.]|nr:hypothetical protein [Treponema sp.]
MCKKNFFKLFGIIILSIITAFIFAACPEDDPTSDLTDIYGDVTISGYAFVGGELSVDTSDLTFRGDLRFNWVRHGENGGSVGTGSTYEIQPEDIGHTITVTVSSSGNSGSVTSLHTNTVPALGAVFGITGVPTWVSARASLLLTGSVVPPDATHQTITWSLVSGPSDAMFTGGNRLTTISPGIAVVRARIANGISNGVDFIEDFPISIMQRVTGIEGHASWALTDTPLALSGNVVPLNATNSDITWSLVNPGTTQAVVTDGTLLAESTGTVTVRATVVDGIGIGSNFSQDISILVNSGAFDQWITPITFTGTEYTVHLKNMIGNDIFLVKINTSDDSTPVPAQNTGRVLSGGVGVHGLQHEEMFLPMSEAHDINEALPPRSFHPQEDRYRSFVPPARLPQDRPRVLAEFVPPQLHDTRHFWIDANLGGSGQPRFESREATLLARGAHGNIWVVGNNTITQSQAIQLSDMFDIIYPATTNIMGYEYGKFPDQTPGGMDGDTHVQILVYNMSQGILGYFWALNWYGDQQAQDLWGWRSNESEMFSISASAVRSGIDSISSTLTHELQHLIHWNMKNVRRPRHDGAPGESPLWFNEMLSMMAEDVIAEMIGLTTQNSGHVIQKRIPLFLTRYYQRGVTEWVQEITSYSTKYAFGAYLLRNYGGAELLRRIMFNGLTGMDSITSALGEVNPGLTFLDVLRRYGEAFIFRGDLMPAHVNSFDREVTQTINGIEYTIFAFDIWNMFRWNSSSVRGPNVFNLSQRQMRQHSVMLHSPGAAWQNVSGERFITFERPVDPSIEFFLMVR